MFPVVLRPENTPPDTPEQRAKDAKKGEIQAALQSGNLDEAMRLMAELLEMRAEYYRVQQGGGQG